MAKLSPKALMQSGLNAQSASEDEFEKIRREHRERDAASPEGKQKESEKKLEETAKKVREGKIPAPSSDDMGPLPAKKKGGMIKKMAGGGKVSQLAKANGIAVRGKTRGKIC